MKRFGNPLLSFAASFLICLAMLGLMQRQGRDKIQTLPSFLVGSGLVIASFIRRSRRRKILLMEIRKGIEMKTL